MNAGEFWKSVSRRCGSWFLAKIRGSFLHIRLFTRMILPKYVDKEPTMIKSRHRLMDVTKNRFIDIAYIYIYVYIYMYRYITIHTQITQWIPHLPAVLLTWSCQSSALSGPAARPAAQHAAPGRRLIPRAGRSLWEYPGNDAVWGVQGKQNNKGYQPTGYRCDMRGVECHVCVRTWDLTEIYEFFLFLFI